MTNCQCHCCSLYAAVTDVLARQVRRHSIVSNRRTKLLHMHVPAFVQSEQKIECGFRPAAVLNARVRVRSHLELPRQVQVQYRSQGRASGQSSLRLCWHRACGWLCGFNGLFGESKADEQACMVNVRRKFVDEFERTGADIAKHAITQVADLYAVEKEVRGKTPEERVALRKEKAKPIFDKLDAWLSVQLPKSPAKPDWPRPSVMRLTACPKRVPISEIGGWNSTTTFVNAAFALSRLAARTTSSWALSAAAKPLP